VGAAVAQATGGTAALVADLGPLTQSLSATSALAEGPLPAAAKDADGPCADSRTLSFDAASLTWTLVVRCGFDDASRTASFDRAYTFRFLDAEGDPMPNYTVGPRTATTLDFGVASGSTDFEGPRLTANHALAPAAWTVDGIDDPATFTVDGSGGRSGTDVVTGDRGTRTSSFTLDHTLVDLAIDQGATFFVQGGTQTGTYDATATLGNGDQRAMRTLALSYTVAFGGGGTATLTLTGTAERFDDTTVDVDETFDLDWSSGSVSR
jgi:hypothetical protein